MTFGLDSIPRNLFSRGSVNKIEIANEVSRIAQHVRKGERTEMERTCGDEKRNCPYSNNRIFSSVVVDVRSEPG